ncbi:MAG: hypothetical protein K2Y18_08925 [Alphaproteobacteria bacterium]|jgi:tRNA G10  N-methylase Trm11|nr:hypothetical protein [Alphaproteobacteria bacterium]
MFAKLLAIALLMIFLAPTTAMDPDFASRDEPHITFEEDLREDVGVKMNRLENVAFRVVSRKQRPPEELEQVLRSIFTLHHHDEELAQVIILSLDQDHLYFLRQIFADEVALQTNIWESLNGDLEIMKAQESARKKEQARLVKLSKKLNSEPKESVDQEGIRLRIQVMERLQASISMESKSEADQLAISLKEAKNKEELSTLEDIENIVEIFDKMLQVKATMNSLEESHKK